MIRPTFLGFDTAKRGIMTSQKGLDISGQNLVNWDSAGYTRQRIEQVAVAPNLRATRYSYNRSGLAGQGVEVNGISQTRDKFLDKRFREENAETGYYDVVNTMLGDIESTIDELQVMGDSGIRASLKEMMDALSNFSKDAYSETYANIVMNTFKNMCQTLQQLSAKLDNVARQQKFDLSVSVQDFNQLVQKLAGVNKAIGDDVGASLNPHFGPNELLDERNLLLDELSKYGEIEIKTNSDNTIVVTMNGHEVVNRSKYDQMEMFPDPNSNLINDSDIPVELRWVSTNQQAELTNGCLKGATDFINGAGPAPDEGQTSKRGIPYYKQKLDTFAQTLVNTVNNFIPNTNTPAIQTLSGRVDDLTAQQQSLNNLLSSFKSLQSKYNAASAQQPPNTTAMQNYEDQWQQLIDDYIGLQYPDPNGAAHVVSNPLATGAATYYDADLALLSPDSQQYKDLKALQDSFASLKAEYDASADPAKQAELVQRMADLEQAYNDKQYQTPGNNTTLTNALKAIDLATGTEAQVQALTDAEVQAVAALRTPLVQQLDALIASAPKKELLGPKSGGVVTAANIMITDAWNSDPSYVISVLDSKQNNQLNQLINALNSDKIVFQSGGERVESTFSEYVVGYSTTLAEDKNYYATRLLSTQTLNYELQDRRDEVSGVVVDEEVANVMLYQKSYSAAARLMTALDEALDVLINRTGVVGL